MGGETVCCVGAIDIFHRDPEVAVELAAAVHADDAQMPQAGGEVGFATEAIGEIVVDG